MKFSNNNLTVTFDSKEEFNNYFDYHELTLLGVPAVFNFETNKSLTFTINNGIACQEEERWTTYWWEITDEDSDACGEEFFTELKNATRKMHFDYVRQLFPNTTVCCHGKVSGAEAEMMGLDTY